MKAQKNDEFRLVVTTIPGLEQTLANELLKMGGKDVQQHTRSVSCVGDLGFMYKINFNLRTGLRVLKPIKKFIASNDKQLYNEIKKIDWAQYLEKNGNLWIDSTLNSENFNHSQYISQVAKDGIADQFRSNTGIRPSVSKERPDIRLNLHIFKDEVTLSLDSSGESLHKRGYRNGTNLAPLNEVLAAGMILLSGWEKHIQFIDPMCGSGTIPIEAALISANIPPGYYRDNFGFMSWKDFDEELWKLISEKSIEKIKDTDTEILASDISKNVLKKAKENAGNANVEDIIKFSGLSFFDIIPTKQRGLIMINPPYGERMEMDDIPKLYKEIGDKLKKDFNGYSCWIITSNLEAIKSIGLHHSRKITLFNGALECKFLKYEMYQGTKKQKNIA
ncbi:MAG: class I SAM-dependent RNA methyltransferase [Bacteroidota bacterium]|jgi:putative N6-adenine-specific DNA methylase